MPLSALIADLKLNQVRSPWAKAQGVAGWTKQLASEVDEVLEVVASDAIDVPHLSEELGDVLWTWIASALALEASGGPSIEELVAGAQAKLRRRKPWVFDGSTDLPGTADEETVRYLAQKALTG
jgi:XTP/dITP diphosphohydrolase